LIVRMIADEAPVSVTRSPSC